MKTKPKDVYTYICVFSTVITSIILICTFLTMYQFKYISQLFNSYMTLQIAIGITMGLWGIRFIVFDKGRKRLVYSTVCIFILVSILFFIIKLVK